jgi:hypothetical protein
MKMGKLARAAWAAAACLIALGGARAHADTISGAADQVLTLVNQARAQAGLAPLTLDPQLTQSAQSFSEYMASANFYAHEGPDGSTPLSRMNAAGFPGTGTWGENIAADYSDADSVMQVWMASPGHRANLLNPTFTRIGIGVAYNANSQWKYYWTHDFGVRAGGNAPGGNALGGSASGSPIGSLPQPQVQPQAPPPQGTTPQALLVYPGSGNPGSRVTLYGRGFGVSAGQVLFNGVPGRVAYWHDTLIGVEIPAGATSGPVVVRASGGDANPLSFVVRRATRRRRRRSSPIVPPLPAPLALKSVFSAVTWGTRPAPLASTALPRAS